MRLVAYRMALVCSVFLPAPGCGGRTAIDDLDRANLTDAGNLSQPHAAGSAINHADESTPHRGAGGDVRIGSAGSDSGLPDRTHPENSPDVLSPDSGSPDGSLRDAGPVDGERTDGAMDDAARVDGEAAPDAERGCASPFLSCSSGGDAAQCVDPRIDGANCGTCGHICNSQESCVRGRCTPCSSTHFQVPVTYATGPMGDYTLPPLVEDLDADGHEDVLVANTDSASLSLFRGDGKGHLSEGTLLDTRSTPYAVRIGDINQDGYKDIVTLASLGLVVHWGSPAHRFSQSDAYDTAIDWTGVFGAGIDLFDAVGDGAPDVVVYTQRRDGHTLLGFAGGAAWGTPPEVVYEGSVPTWTRNFQAVDADGDGDVDLALLGSGVHLLVNDGKGKFELRQDLTGPNPGKWRPLRILDLNHDGRLDIAGVECLSGDWGPDMLWMALGNEAGGFERLEASRNLGTNAGEPNFVFHDLDDDGMIDIVAREDDANKVQVFRGSASGEFRQFTQSDIAAGLAGMALADLTGDGRLDLVVAHEASQAVSVHEGKADGTFRSEMLSLPRGTSLHSAAWLSGTGAGSPHVVAVGGTDDGRFRVFSILDSTQVSMTQDLFVYRPETVSLADVDGDGRPDALVPAERALYWLRNLGNGQFADPAVISSSCRGERAFAGDFDGDGQQEVVITFSQSAGDTLQVFKRDASNETWSEADYAMNDFGTLAVGDITSDGLDDVVALVHGSASGAGILQVWLGSRSGALVSKALIDLPSFGWAVQIHDLDGDGIGDVFVGHNKGYIVLRGDANATLETLAEGSENIAYPGFPTESKNLLFADIDHDGVLDILAASEDRTRTLDRSSGVTLWHGLGRGRFEPTEAYRVPGANRAVSVGDIDHDGIDDLLLAGGSPSAGSLMWLRGNNRCR